ncbi:NUDIX hydrolase [Brevibacillus sp. SYP-B805]|uniref:NUDIX domain-containing protein n=1 Tax=Brevibacillus sp. SYP-B805 TaxID=1578199 RepID=UPI0013EB3EB4|nr:NUDIX hydrolase [Brevibacillus sp. SYP-B805]NGQ95276.1 NUDIX hydrolase [Brevibacillus sp. SYP-B805]
MNQIRLRVSVVVVHDGKILLIKEVTDGVLAYSLPGGGVEFLESIPEATRREVWEETGVLVAYQQMLWLDERIDRNGDGKHTVGVGVLAALVGEETTPIPGGLEDEEIVWAGWVSLEELHTLPFDNDRRREQVLKALKEANYLPGYIGNVM